MSRLPIALLIAAALCAEERPPHPWLDAERPADALEKRIAPPDGFTRTPAEEGSFAAWLRTLPLKPGNPPVLLFNGAETANQQAHAAVLDIDVGHRDLQQCADSVIRLRAEYLYSRAQPIAFHFTSGDEASFARWSDGFRPKVSGNAVEWTKSAKKNDAYPSLRAYLDIVFTYAGTRSLAKELHAVPDVHDLQAGDVFVQGGSPGHAILVADVAEQKETGRRVFLLVQGYMPAQQIHLLKNPSDASLSPWYGVDFGEALSTPQWTFHAGDLKRF